MDTDSSEDTKGLDPLKTLPEISLKILSYIGKKQLVELCLVSKHWKREARGFVIHEIRTLNNAKIYDYYIPYWSIIKLYRLIAFENEGKKSLKRLRKN